MSAERVFLDTNILVYAHDLDAGERHVRAKRLIRDLWRGPSEAWLSVQVLQELYVSLLRLGMPETNVAGVVRDHMGWPVVENTAELLRSAISARARWRVSLWDALILAAAHEADAVTLWTEDLNDGQDYGGVVARNPLTA